LISDPHTDFQITENTERKTTTNKHHLRLIVVYSSC